VLRELKLKPVYDSAEHDLIQDLVVPLLRNSISYLRGVGFFTSGWLRLAAQGLSSIIERGGSARIVLSPIMEQADWEAFQMGEEAKHNQTLKKVLEKNVDDIVHALESHTLNALAWMIADDLVDFRFAVIREPFFGGDYHDKVAVFGDEQGNMVAIHGSFNDSIKGSLNGEAFSVFKSWEEGQRPFADQHYKRLSQLWSDKNPQFRVFLIPEAIKQRIIRLRTTKERPYNLPQSKKLMDSSPSFPGITLYEYQKDALQSWLDVDCKGVLEMATGTGKTLTALACAFDRYQALGKLALIVLVPYLHLLEQWEVHCRTFRFQPILCSGNHNRWHLAVQSKIQDFNIGAVNAVCLIVVHATASTEKFSRATRALKQANTMVIGDEVHNLGSSQMKKALIGNTGLRLGLSATPRRWFDEKGTESIFDYFGPVCFEFPLEKAIGKYLVPYEYKPELINLTPEESDQYEDLSTKISKLLSLAKKNEDDTDIVLQLKKALLERARIIGNAESKVIRLLEIFREMIDNSKRTSQELGHILVYCAPGSHRDIIKLLSGLGLRCHEFVHYVSLSDRQRILDEFASRRIQVLVAIKCLDEGVDVPSTETAFLLASTSNPREFIQRRGRILRLSEGKEKAIIYDFIIVPRPEYVPLRRDIDAGLLRREMPRFAEFASAAANEFNARSVLWSLLDQYELLNLFDQKPWDIYDAVRQDVETMGIIT
jgi:superfamily II DNA or RNA helicase